VPTGSSGWLRGSRAGPGQDAGAKPRGARAAQAAGGARVEADAGGSGAAALRTKLAKKRCKAESGSALACLARGDARGAAVALTRVVDASAALSSRSEAAASRAWALSQLVQAWTPPPPPPPPSY